MILRPVTAYPDNGVAIDADKTNQFTTTIEGSSAKVTGYYYTAYNADTFKEEDPGLGKQTLATPLTAGDTLTFDVDNTHPAHAGQSLIQNGNSYYWILRLYQDVADMFIASGTIINVDSTTVFRTANNVNIQEGMFVNLSDGVNNKGIWKITGIYRYPSTDTTYFGQMQITIETPSFTFDTTFNGNKFKVYSDYVDSQPFYFLARKTPELEINDYGTVDTMSKTFTATYSQADGDGIKWHKFTLSNSFNVYDSLTNDAYDTLIDDTGEIYSSDLTYNADGLIEGQVYKLRCTVCTVNNMVVTDTVLFIPTYDVPTTDRNANISQLTDRDAVRLTWNGDYEVEATDRSNYSVNDGWMDLHEGNIYYEKINGESLNIPDDATFLTDVIVTQDTNEILSLDWGVPSAERDGTFAPLLRRDFSTSDQCKYATTVSGTIKNDLTCFYMRAITYGKGMYIAVGDAGQSYATYDLKKWYFVKGIPNTGIGGEIAYGRDVFCAIGSDGNVYYLDLRNGNFDIENLQWVKCDVSDSSIKSDLIYSDIGFILSLDNNETIWCPTGIGIWLSLADTGGHNFFVNNRLILTKGDLIYEYSGSPFSGGEFKQLGTYPTSTGLYKITYNNNTYITLDESGKAYRSDNLAAWTVAGDLNGKPLSLITIDNNNETVLLLENGNIYSYGSNGWTMKYDYIGGNLLTYLNNKCMGYSLFSQLAYNSDTSDLNNNTHIVFPFGDVQLSAFGDNITMLAFRHLYYAISNTDRTFQIVYGITPSYNSVPTSLAYGDGCFVTSCNGNTYISYSGSKFTQILNEELKRIVYYNHSFIGETANGELVTALKPNYTSWNVLGELPANVVMWGIDSNGTIVCVTSSGQSSYSKNNGASWTAISGLSSGYTYNKEKVQMQLSQNMFILCVNYTDSSDHIDKAATYYLDTSKTTIGSWQLADTTYNGSITHSSLISDGTYIYASLYDGARNAFLQGSIRGTDDRTFDWFAIAQSYLSPTETLAFLSNELTPTTLRKITLKMKNGAIIKESNGEEEVLVNIGLNQFEKRYKVAIINGDIRIKEVAL